METNNTVIEINNLVRRYGKLDAVNGLNLKVRAGRCYGFFGRNPALNVPAEAPAHCAPGHHGHADGGHGHDHGEHTHHG